MANRFLQQGSVIFQYSGCCIVKIFFGRVMGISGRPDNIHCQQLFRYAN